MKIFHKITIVFISVMFAFSFIACEKNSKTEHFYEISYDGIELAQKVPYGSKIDEPAKPTKESTPEYDFEFDGWYIDGSEKKWDFMVDKIQGDINFVSRFKSVYREYNIKIGSTLIKKAYGSRVPEPVEPTKAPINDCSFIFDGWYIVGTDIKWNFRTNKVTGELALEARFTTVEKGAVISLAIKPYEITVGGEAIALYNDLKILPSEVSVTINNLDTNQNITRILNSLTTDYKVEAGNYRINVKYKSNTYTTNITLLDKQVLQVNGYVSSTYLGGSITIPNSRAEKTTYLSYNNASIDASSGVNWKLENGQRDTITVSSHTYVFQHNFSGNKYYVEGVFNTAQKFDLSHGFGGLLISHGADELKDSSDKKFMAGIYGKSVVVCYAEDWSADNTSVIANFDTLGVVYSPQAVKLGVVRDKIHYYFFVNDVYVGDYALPQITNVCGVGVAGIPATVTISKFNYSSNQALMSKLIACAKQKNQIDIYLIAGQSNAAGYSSYNLNNVLSIDDSLAYGYNNIFYSGNAQQTDFNSYTAITRTLNWGLARVGQGIASNKLGAEAGMAQTLSQYYSAESGKVAGIIKFAQGGTSLLDNIGGENQCDGNWVSPLYEATITPKSPGKLTGGLYRKLLTEVAKNINYLKVSGYTSINIKGLF